jgi:putative cell wall-binding protein
MKKLEEAKLKEIAEAFFKEDGAQAKFVLVTEDGNIFLPEAVNDAKYHAHCNDIEVYTFKNSMAPDEGFTSEEEAISYWKSEVEKFEKEKEKVFTEIHSREEVLKQKEQELEEKGKSLEEKAKKLEEKEEALKKADTKQK